MTAVNILICNFTLNTYSYSIKIPIFVRKISFNLKNGSKLILDERDRNNDGDIGQKRVRTKDGDVEERNA